MSASLEDLFRQLIAKDEPFTIHYGGPNRLGHRLAIREEDFDPHFTADRPIVWLNVGEELEYVYGIHNMESFDETLVGLLEQALAGESK